MNRRSLLKGLAAVTAGLTALATRPSVEATPINLSEIDFGDDEVGQHVVTVHPNFPAMPAIADSANASHTHADYFETPRYDASMSSWVKLIDCYDVDGELRTYRLTSMGTSPA
jgi:hypothetical protein